MSSTEMKSYLSLIPISAKVRRRQTGCCRYRTAA